MSSGAEHSKDITTRLKQNRAMLPSQRERYGKYEGRYAKHDRPDKVYHKEISHPKLRNIKKHIRDRANKENREVLVITVLVTAVLILISFWILS